MAAAPNPNLIAMSSDDLDLLQTLEQECELFLVVPPIHMPDISPESSSHKFNMDAVMNATARGPNEDYISNAHALQAGMNRLPHGRSSSHGHILLDDGDDRDRTLMDLDSMWKPPNDPDLFSQSLVDINMLHNIGHGGMSTPADHLHHHHHHHHHDDMHLLYNPSSSEQPAQAEEDKEEDLVEMGDYHKASTTTTSTLSWYNDSNIGTRPLSIEHMGHHPSFTTIPSHDHHSLNYNYTYNGDHPHPHPPPPPPPPPPHYHHHHHHHDDDDNAAFQYVNMPGSALSPMPPADGHIMSNFGDSAKPSVMSRLPQEDAPRTITMMTGVGPPETMAERAHIGHNTPHVGHNTHLLVNPNIKSCGSNSNLLIPKGTQYNSCDDLSDTNHHHHEDDDHDWDNHLHYTNGTTTNTTITTNNNNNNNNASSSNCSSMSAKFPGTTSTSKNLVSERRRRKNLNERLYSLRAIVPKISKMDKASIVGDAISYLQDLQKQVADMQTDIRNLQTSKTDPEVQDQSTSSCEENNNVDHDVNISQHENFVEHKILQLDVCTMENNTYHLMIHCKKGRGVLVQLTRALEALNFEIVNANLTAISDHILNTVVIKVSKDDVLKPEELKEMVLEIVPMFGLYV